MTLSDNNRLSTRSQAGKDLVLQGKTASRGFVQGHVFVYDDGSEVEPQSLPVSDYQGFNQEVLRLSKARDQALRSLDQIISQTRTTLGDEAAHIFRSQQTMIEDESIHEEMAEYIRQENARAELAVSFVFDQYIELFSQMGDEEYNKARVADVQDVKQRLVRKLMGKEDFDPESMPLHALVVAKDLLPSDTAMFNKQRVSGIILQEGGVTSHAAILANNLGIPAAVGVHGVIEKVCESVISGSAESCGCSGWLDCRTTNAIIVLDPSPTNHDQLTKEHNQYQIEQRLIQDQKDQPSVTKDGHTILLSANIGTPEEARHAKDLGAQSVGLFRSEFLFLGKDQLPDEETQFLAYKEVLELFAPGFVIIRTLDAGGDKKIPTVSVDQEENPFLGYRALRISLDREDIFLPQLRALLRASVYGNLKVMFPMVAGIDDLRRAMDLVNKVKNQLESQSIPISQSVEFGVMIEIPSVVFSLDQILKEVDFVSVGTNDLTQYLFAADRMNSRVSQYYRSFDPALFRCLAEIGQKGTKAGKMVGICGELGGNPDAIPALVGMGYSELSMSAHSLAYAKYVIRDKTLDQCVAIAQNVINLEDQEQVLDYVRSLSS
jgi:phosphotransferase system enzyme I (PtsI)